MSRPPQRILLYRLGSLGDTVVALPALHLVARAFPHAERRLLTNHPVHTKAPAAAEILAHTHLIHGFFPYPVATRNPFRLLALLVRIRLWRPDVLIYLASARGLKAARRDARFFRLAGIPHQIGVPLTEDQQQNRLEPSGDREPEAARLTRNLSSLGDPHLDDPASWDIHLTPEEHAQAQTVLAPASAYPILTVSIGTKMQSKDWGSENWLLLLKELAAKYPTHALALLGAAEEREASEQAAQAWRTANPNPALNLCGALTPRESTAVLARSHLFLGHDSGPMHLAAAVQTPVVAIFSARNLPRVWFPYGPRHRVLYHRVSCRGCNLETCLLEKKRCILSITIPEVLTAIEQVIQHPSVR